MKFSLLTTLTVLASMAAAAPTPSGPIKPRDSSISRKRLLLWDYTNTEQNPQLIDQISFDDSHPFSAVANWNSWYPTELNDRAPFRPMARTTDSFSGSDWTYLTASTQPILAFLNEPDQAGTSVATAVSLWRSQFLPLRTSAGKKLIGPAVASNDAGTAWLDAFYAALADDEKPDYLALHYYGTSAADAQTYLQDMYARYGSDAPVVVSEIASISRDQTAVNDFTASMANWLDAQDWVYEYGFFGCMRALANDYVSPEAQLMTSEGAFTPLMQRLMTQVPVSSSS